MLAVLCQNFTKVLCVLWRCYEIDDIRMSTMQDFADTQSICACALVRSTVTKRASYGTDPAQEFSHTLQRSYLLQKLTHYCYLLGASTSSRWRTCCIWFFVVRVSLTSIPIYPFQVKLFSELGKIESSLQELHKMKLSKDISQYSIEVIELF